MLREVDLGEHLQLRWGVLEEHSGRRPRLHSASAWAAERERTAYLLQRQKADRRLGQV
jgi:hypothetical protein